jgi:hypothetical protein
MAVISKEHKFIFFQNPRTGSTMLEKVLIDEFDGRLFPEPKNQTEKMSYKHLTYNQLLTKKYITKKELDQYFKFVTVRNPYSKVVSDWLGGKKFYKEHTGKQTRIENILANNTNTLEEYLKAVLIKGFGIETRVLLARKLPNIVFIILAYIYYLARSTTKDKFLIKEMNLIIRIENLQEGFEKFCKLNLLAYTGKLPVINKTNMVSNPPAYYHSSFSKKLVSIMYSDILKKYKYTYEEM